MKRTAVSSFYDSKSVRTVADELEKKKRIKTYFQENDKTPNTDGYFETLDDSGYTLKRFVVQIKGEENLTKLKAGQYSYQAEADFFQYILNGGESNPGVFFVVERATGTVFFKYLSPEYLQNLTAQGIWGKKTHAIHLDKNDILEENKFYQLCEMIRNKNKSVRNINNQNRTFMRDVTKKSIRKISEELWVDWNKGCIIDNESKEINLTSGELRMLSVLVQGEGSVVCWDELYWRGIVMQQEIDDLKEGRKNLFKEEIDNNGRKKKVKDAICVLCTKVLKLSNIIVPAENEKGYRIILSGIGSKSAEGDFCSLFELETTEKDWDCIHSDNEQKKAYCSTDAWLRRHYAQICGSFEGRVSNAGGSTQNERVIFGDYKMVETYTNAYASEVGLGRPEAMLDYVEKWYTGRYIMESGRTKNLSTVPLGNVEDRFGRVLVLHGHPGDGKTTFCKKAVYAYCFEGWLKEAPHVLCISLNKNESGGNIISDGKLRLPMSLGLCQNELREFSYCNPSKIGDGALIIFDGYDELAGDLNNIEGASTFSEFYEQVKEYAELLKWNIIITSRTMCIERELKEQFNRHKGKQVASFAPMTPQQQDLMIERMIELDELRQQKTQGSRGFVNGMSSEQEIMDLKHYQKNVLPKLRKKEGLKKLLLIPILFRMIVVRRFDDVNEGETEAELYSNLFHSLMNYKNRRHEKEKKLLKEYEEIAARIFNYNNDTCPFGEDSHDENKELIYLFLTKNDRIEKGQLGFLHGVFNQYFLARYIVSGIQAINVESNELEFMSFFKNLRAARISEPVVWQMVAQITVMKGTEKDPFNDSQVSVNNIVSVRKQLNEEMVFAQGMIAENAYATGPNVEHRRLPGVENAIFNLMCSLAAIEKGLRYKVGQKDSKTQRSLSDREGVDILGGYHEYKNISNLFRRGEYQGIYLEGVDFRECGLQGANLKRAQLKGACLSGADFSEANLQGADLEGADLSGAIFKGTNLIGANLDCAKIQNANFEMADLTGASLRKVVSDISGYCLSSIEISEQRATNFRAANLKKAILKGAKLINTHFESANLYGANLTDANLFGANLTGANLGRACIENANLKRANLQRAQINEAVLNGANFEMAFLEESFMEGSVLEGTNLKNAHLGGACLRAAYLDGTISGRGLVVNKELSASEAVLDGAILKGVDLECSFLSEEQYKYARMGEAFGLPLEIQNTTTDLVVKSQDGKIAQLDEISNRDQQIIGVNKPYSLLFGNYKQGKDGEVQALSWYILRWECSKVLIITEKLIDFCSYNDSWKDITWEQCKLRKWLNEEFLYNAFDEKERARIVRVCNQNPDNESFNTKGGNPTWDRIFALSIDETKRYFCRDADMRAAITPFAYEQMCLENKEEIPGGENPERWWLRSPGDFNNDASYVDSEGRLHDDGCGVDIFNIYVRPALWLNL